MRFISRVAVICAVVFTAGISHTARIMVDINGVIADFEQQALIQYQEKYPNEPSLEKKDRTEINIVKDYTKISSKHETYMSEALAEEGFCLTIPLIEDAQKALNEMTEQGHSVFLVSEPMAENNSCLQEKYDWVKENLGEEWVSRIVITSDKTILKADILIDDDPSIVGDEKSPSWKQVLFDQPYNTGDDQPRITQWKNWETIVAPLLSEN